MRFLFIAIALMSFCGCGDHPSDAKLSTVATIDLTSCAEGVHSLTVDCGKKRVLDGKMPDALYRNPGWPGWKGPYLDGDGFLQDGWGRPYRFEPFSSGFRVISNGPDRTAGTSDDIIVIVQLSGITNEK